MHSPSRVQIPPSPLPAPGFRWNPGASSLSVPGADLCAWVLGAGFVCVGSGSGRGLAFPVAPVVRADPVRSCGWLLNNVARNFPVNLSVIEIWLLQFQRFCA